MQMLRLVIKPKVHPFTGVRFYHIRHIFISIEYYPKFMTYFQKYFEQFVKSKLRFGNRIIPVLLPGYCSSPVKKERFDHCQILSNVHH